MTESTNGMLEPWEVFPEGSDGEWVILSEGGFVIATGIPFGEYADHIVEMHNKRTGTPKVVEADTTMTATQKERYQLTEKGCLAVGEHIIENSTCVTCGTEVSDVH